MIIIGVTGNSGAGKSTVSTIIKNNTGALVIDADKLSKEMMVKGEEYYNETVELFGEDILIQKEKNKGKIDKAKFATALFNDEEKRKKLNKLTFKYVGEETKKIILENKDKDFIVLDFPLLYEGGFDKICNYVIGVVSDDESKIKRLKERDRISREQALIRISTQIDEEILKEKVDYVVTNVEKTRYINLVKDVIKLIHKIKKEEEEKNKK